MCKQADRLSRIAFYEHLYETLCALPPQVEHLTGRYAFMYAALEEYYASGRWLEDYEADEAGLIPANVKRGVLSQDGLYDLLSRWQ